MKRFWFRYYTEALDDPKVQNLEPSLFKTWVNLLCVACKYDGVIEKRNVSFALRCEKTVANEQVFALIEHGLFDDLGDIISPHNWGNRQYPSDTSTERVKRFRKQKRNGVETPIVEKSRVDIYGRFAELWIAYPKKQSKKTAEKAYARALKEVSHDAIMVGLERSKRSDSRFRELKFTPLLATWLNSGGWGDEPPKPPGENWRSALV
jgi:hypothetical protein